MDESSDESHDRKRLLCACNFLMQYPNYPTRRGSGTRAASPFARDPRCDSQRHPEGEYQSADRARRERLGEYVKVLELMAR